jgi:hypothetical protein
MDQGTTNTRSHSPTPALTLEELLSHVDWRRESQPRWNEADTVPSALRALASCKDKVDSERAYNSVLSSLGNNHAGTYYPVVLAMMPCLEFILSLGEPIPQEMAMCVI